MPPTPDSWSLGRFLKTLAYFEAIPFLPCIQQWFKQPEAAHSAVGQPQGEVVFDFPTLSPEQFQAVWGPLDDVVMGGVSQSTAQLTNLGACFSGIVSTANSGGFASLRTRNFDSPLDLSAWEGMRLRVQGDGQRYKFLLRSDSGWDSVAYAYSFDTVADQWIEVTIPFADLIPVFRARTVPDAPRLNSGQIASLQVMLSKFEYDGALNPHFAAGPFQLTITQISAYRSLS